MGSSREIQPVVTVFLLWYGWGRRDHSGSQNEYDLLSRNNGFNTGRAGNSVGFSWLDMPLSAIGVPGRLPLVNIASGNIGEGDDGLQSFREQRSVSAYLNIEPFSQLKNQWIRGL